LVVSALRREEMSPVLVTSKKPISCLVSARKSMRRSRRLTRAPTTVKMPPRRPVQMPAVKAQRRSSSMARLNAAGPSSETMASMDAPV